MPTISRQDLSPSHTHVTITLTREDLRPKLDSEFKKLKQRATVKGFRPGQAPAQYVKSLYGASLFYDVFNKMMSDQLYGFLNDEKLDVLGQPLPVETEDQKKYTFKFDNPEPEYALTYEIGHVPQFELVGIDKGQVYERYEISNLDELAAVDFENMRKEAGKQSEVDDKIQDTDLVRVEAKEMDGDSPKVDGWQTRVLLFTNTIPNEALKADILGKKKGDTIRFDVSEVEAERDEKFTRKYLLNLPDDDNREVGNIFEGEIVEVLRKKAADVDEEFFKAAFGGQVDNEADALELIKKNTADYYQNRANALVFRAMQDRLLALNNVDIPEAFLKRWLAVSNEGTLSAEQIEEEYESFALGLRWSFIKNKLVERFDITVNENEIRQEFFVTLNSYFRGQFPMDMLAGAVNRMMADKKEVDRVTSNIEYDKMFNAAIAEITIQNKAITSEAFQALFDKASNKAAEEI